MSAQYSAPALLVDKIKLGDFRGVYMDLHAAATTGTKIFVQDMGPDGLFSKSDNGDSWEEAGKTTTFDGQWKKSKSTEAEYTKTLSDADERYAKMLSLLLTQVKQVKKIGSCSSDGPAALPRGGAWATLRTSSVGRLAQW